MKVLGKRFRLGNSGATLLEYGLMAGGIALAIAAILIAQGDNETPTARHPANKVETTPAQKSQ